MLEMRTFENRPGQVYDPTDLTRLFAEDINALVEYVNTLLLIVDGVLDLGYTQVILDSISSHNETDIAVDRRLNFNGGLENIIFGKALPIPAWMGDNAGLYYENTSELISGLPLKSAFLISQGGLIGEFGCNMSQYGENINPTFWGAEYRFDMRPGQSTVTIYVQDLNNNQYPVSVFRLEDNAYEIYSNLNVLGDIQAYSYKSADGNEGLTTTQTFKDSSGVNKTFTIENGLIVGIA